MYKVLYFSLKKGENATKTPFPEKIAIVQDHLDTFVTRLNGNPFHGGEYPDAADFRMFSCINRFQATKTMMLLLKGRGEEDPLDLWFKRMGQVCRAREWF